MRRTPAAMVVALSLACASCGDDTAGSGGGGAGGAAGGGVTASSASGSSTSSAGGADGGSTTGEASSAASTSTGNAGDIPDFNGCTTDDYVDGTDGDFDRTVLVGDAGLLFNPKCLKIAGGQSVTFDGSFTAHPIGPGNPEDHAAGSPDSPITATTSGTAATFTFSAPGTYPYYCMLHGFGDGMGMAGVIHVE